MPSTSGFAEHDLQRRDRIAVVSQHRGQRRGSTRESVNHLIRVHGKKRIALLRGIEGTEGYDERFRGWQAAFQSNGLSRIPR